MKIFLRLTLLMFVTVMGLFSFTGKEASAYGCPINGSASTYIVDNDNRFLNNTTDNGWNGTWSHGKTSSDYNGDHRFNASGVSGDYFWKLGPCTEWRSYAVYLNNYKFTDPNAAYYLRTQAYPSGPTHYFGTLNQYTAPGGWNYIKGQVGPTVTSDKIWLNVMSYFNATGADAAKLVTY